MSYSTSNNIKFLIKFVNVETGEVILPAGTEITYRRNPNTGKSTADILSENRESFRKTYEYEVMLQGNSVVLETLDVLVKTCLLYTS